MKLFLFIQSTIFAILFSACSSTPRINPTPQLDSSSAENKTTENSTLENGASPKMNLDDFSEKIAHADTKNISLSRKKLLEILSDQQKFFKRMSNDGRLRESETISSYRRLLSVWESYLLENPNDEVARIIYAKFLRSTGKNSDAYAEFCTVDKLNPRYAVVKQQMATFEAETGLIKEAYEHIIDALNIEPENAVYYSQLSKLLVARRDVLEEYLKCDAQTYDNKIMQSYALAAKYAPADLRAQTDCALSFYDLSKPDWNKALLQWRHVEKMSALNVDRQVALANIARVLVELNRDAEAEKILKSITLDSLKEIKMSLLGEIERAKRDGVQNKIPSKKTYSY